MSLCCGAQPKSLTVPTLLRRYNPSVVRRSSKLRQHLATFTPAKLKAHPAETSPSQSSPHLAHHTSSHQTDLRDLQLCGNSCPSVIRFFDSSPYRRLDQDTRIVASAVSIIDRIKTLPVSTPGCAIPVRRTIAHHTLLQSIECFE